MQTRADKYKRNILKQENGLFTRMLPDLEGISYKESVDKLELVSLVHQKETSYRFMFSILQFKESATGTTPKQLIWNRIVNKCQHRK